MLIVTHQQNDIPTSAMTVPKLTIKVKKWAATQFLELPTCFTKELEYSSYFLHYEITQPYEN